MTAEMPPVLSEYLDPSVAQDLLSLPLKPIILVKNVFSFIILAMKESSISLETSRWESCCREALLLVIGLCLQELQN